MTEAEQYLDGLRRLDVMARVKEVIRARMELYLLTHAAPYTRDELVGELESTLRTLGHEEAEVYASYAVGDVSVTGDVVNVDLSLKLGV